MLSKTYRTPKEKIPFILKKGEQEQSRLFIIRYSKNSEDFSRYRVIISKKLEPKAVNRNKLRRQVYEAIRTELVSKGENRDLVLIPKKNILSANYQQIAEDLKKWTN